MTFGILFGLLNMVLAEEFYLWVTLPLLFSWLGSTAPEIQALQMGYGWRRWFALKTFGLALGFLAASIALWWEPMVSLRTKLAVGALLIQLWGLAWVDTETGWLPDWMTYPLCLSGFLASAALGGFEGPARLGLSIPYFWDSLLGGVTGFFLFSGCAALLGRIKGQAQMGGGDGKLAAGIGAWMGAMAVVYTALLACWLALGRSIIFSGMRTVRFAPYLAASAASLLLFRLYGGRSFTWSNAL